MTREIYSRIRAEELTTLTAHAQARYREAAELLDALVLPTDFTEFLTVPAYERLDAARGESP
jgi:malate synthase